MKACSLVVSERKCPCATKSRKTIFKDVLQPLTELYLIHSHSFQQAIFWAKKLWSQAGEHSAAFKIIVKETDI